MRLNEVIKSGKDYVGYDYMTITTDQSRTSMYLDGYENFGWMLDESSREKQIGRIEIWKLKRDRKILNKMELTRLQHHFEACMDEIKALETSKAHTASIAALSVGLIGTAFMAGSVFAVTHDPPVIFLCALLAIPGFIGWALPYFLFKSLIRRRVKIVEPLIEQKYDEIYELCRKGNALLRLS